MRKNCFVVATTKSWNYDYFEKYSEKLYGDWFLITQAEDLTYESLKRLNPRFIFFPHWSSIVAPPIFNTWECVCFHMTALPFGRGGSPLQNLIQRGYDKTLLTAFHMDGGIDSGPIYYQIPLSLKGSAEEIYKRATKKIWKMIAKIIHEKPMTRPQIGEPVLFRRRKPNESEIPENLTENKLYDHIRMLDASDYPAAFINYDGWHVEFRDAVLNSDSVTAMATFIKKK